MKPSIRVITEYTKILSNPSSTPEQIGFSIAIPRFSEEHLIALTEEAKQALMQDPNTILINDPVVIVGDLHGNLRDLIRIIANMQPPPKTKYLFLGDYVDRGEFSLEVITFLFALKAQFPDSIFLLRGNHEFSSVNISYGFHEQVMNMYHSDTLWTHFNNAFQWLPLGAIVSNTVLCVHGGISANFTSVSQLDSIQRPISECLPGVLTDIMWSDPSVTTDDFIPSNRGMGCFFGKHALKHFLRENNLTHIIRSHQCVSAGVQVFDKGLCYTVFSCSNYCGVQGNLLGIISICGKSIKPYNLPVLNIPSHQTAINYSQTDDCKSCEDSPCRNHLRIPSHDLRRGTCSMRQIFVASKRMMRRSLMIGNQKSSESIFPAIS